jgi:hypothetical protein
MEKMSLYKRRDFGEVLNESTTFITQNFRIYSKGFLYFVLGPLLLVMIASVYSSRFGLDPAIAATNPRFYLSHFFGDMLPALLLVLFLVSIVYIIQTVLSYEFLILYEAKDDPSTITVGEMWDSIRANFWRMVGSYLGLILIFLLLYIITAFIVGLIFVVNGVLGFLFLLGALVFWIYLLIPVSSLFFAVRENEKLGVFDSIRRCYRLASRHWWRTFGLMFVVGLVVWVLKMLFVAPLYLIISLIKAHYINVSFETSIQLTTTLTYIIQALSLAAGLYFSAVANFVSAFNYYSLAENTDNISLLEEINTIGQKPEPENAQEGEF